MNIKRSVIIFAVLCSMLLLGAAQISAQEVAYANCFQPARLYVGGSGRVVSYPAVPNRIRTQPNFGGAVIGRIPAGAQFSVIGGPQCSAGILWWYVNYNGVIGWTAEGNGAMYYLEPVGATPPPPACALPNRLQIGVAGRVTPGLPNVVRDYPGTTASGANSRVIGEIPAGGVFAVLNGPQCGSDGRWWWLVNYNGLVGWTAEGEGTSTYWTEPYAGDGAYACPGFMYSRLYVGGYGAVTYDPPYPNRLRTSYSFNSVTIGLIPVGGVFKVLQGPVCSEGTAWWYVNYNGVVGWTAEGQGNVYWLEPR